MTSTQARVLVTGGSGFIGCSLTRYLTLSGFEVHNLDVRAPSLGWGAGQLHRVDLMDFALLKRTVRNLDPHVVIHLAARTDTDSAAVSDYRVNFEGTRNLVNALEQTGCTQLVAVSTQFVIGPGRPFDDVLAYAPHTAYGESKVLMETDLRSTPPSFEWLVLRPTNVWGPGHLRYARQFWRVLDQGLYLHPSTPAPVRSYAYVGNVCAQIVEFCRSTALWPSGATYYLGDLPISQDLWVDTFARALTGRPARRAPVGLLRLLAAAGEATRRLGLPAPLTSSRLRSMLTDYPTPMTSTQEALGMLSPVSLQEGILETVAWLRLGMDPNFSQWAPRSNGCLSRDSHDDAGA